MCVIYLLISEQILVYSLLWSSDLSDGIFKPAVAFTVEKLQTSAEATSK